MTPPQRPDPPTIPYVSHQQEPPMRAALEAALYGPREQIAMAKACGPIALSAICRARGKGVSLGEAISATSWTPDNPSSLNVLASAAGRLTGGNWSATDVGIEDRSITLRTMNLPAILVSKPQSGDLAHAFAVLDRDSDGKWLCYDYPARPASLSEAELLERWSGSAVHRLPATAAETAGNWPITSFALLTLCALVLIRFGARISNHWIRQVPIVVIILGIWNASASGSSPPDFETVAIDCGRVRQGDMVQRTVEMRNQGSEPLELGKPVVSCAACVHVETELAGLVIPPGKSIPVKISFNSSGKRGRVSQWAFITERGGRPVLRVMIDALVASAWTNVSVINAGVIEPGQPIEIKIFVLGDQGSTAHVSDASIQLSGSTAPLHVIEASGAIASQGARVLARCEGQARAPSALGHWEARVELEVDDEGVKTRLTVPVIATVTAVGGTRATALYLGVHKVGAASAPVDIEVAVRTPPERASTALPKVRSSDPRLSVEVVSFHSPIITIRVRLRPESVGAASGSQLQPQFGTVAIVFPGEPSLELPFAFVLDGQN